MALQESTLNLLAGIAEGFTWREARQPSSHLPARESTRSSHRSDTVLIQACLDGDDSAWKALVARYQCLVYSIPRGYGLPPDDCDDIFQNVFTIVFRSLARLRDQSRLSAWLITITHRQCRHAYKQTGLDMELDENLLDPQPPPPELVQRLERRQIIHQALSQLDTRSQALLKALFFDASKPSYQEIADRLGMPVGSISPTRLRCFKKLETILHSLDPDLSH